jgi:hypothetical protein
MLPSALAAAVDVGVALAIEEAPSGVRHPFNKLIMDAIEIAIALSSSMKR